MKISEIITHIEELAPLQYQESYDNAGLLIGSLQDEVNSALICLDVTEDVVNEAIENGHKLIIAHHPIIFGGLKSINGKNEVERCVIKSIKNEIAIYVAHTNLDSVEGGVNSKICDLLQLGNRKLLSPAQGKLSKLITYVPASHSGKLSEALFAAGAGHIGNYDKCAFSVDGEGSFRANNNATPFVGELGKVHIELEKRLELIVPNHKLQAVLSALQTTHPYEEPAYDIYALSNSSNKVGIGLVGELETPQDEESFFRQVKSTFGCRVIKHSKLLGKPIKRVAVCGGAGSFLIKNAMAAKADVFITGDMKYHDFFLAENKIVLADIGHFESEQFTQEIFRDLLTEKIPNFALQLTAHCTNAANYFI